MNLKDKNLYYVGGVVRDEFLNATSFDIDFCYEGNAIEFAQKNGLNIIKTNPDFGTVRVLASDGEFVDIASTREETYPKAGHLPIVQNIGCSLKDDLKRRDFTMNAMAKNTLTGEVVDYFGGLDDIKNKKLRVLHKRSFIDDPTRIIRGLKFSLRFGFDLEDETKKLQDEYLDNINYDMSYHRLKKELKETFNLNNKNAYKRFLEEGIYKLLGQDIISFPANSFNDALISKYSPNSPWLVYLGNFDLSKLELNAEERAIVSSVPNIIPDSDFTVYKMFKTLPLESILLYAINIDYNTAIHYLDDLKDIKIEINGYDLLNLGIKQGKIYSEIFDYLLREKFANPTMTKNQELEFVRSKYGT